MDIKASKYLVSQGADINVKDNSGKTPLDSVTIDKKQKILPDIDRK